MGARGVGLLWVVVVMGAPACADDAPQAPGIASFPATSSWGSTPLKVDFAWTLQLSAGSDVSCSIDVDRDGAFEIDVSPCPPSGSASHVIKAWGRHEPQLVVRDAAGNAAMRAVTIFANQLEYQPWVVFPEQLPGITSVAVQADQVALSFSGPPPAIKVGTILWGRSGEGFLLRVLSTSTAGNVVTLKTTQAYVTQAVKQGFFGVQRYVPTLQGARCIEQCQGVTIKPKENVHTTSGPDLQLTINFPSPKPIMGVSISPSMELGLAIDEFALQIKPGANELRLKQSFTVKQNFHLELEELSTKVSVPLGKISLGVITLGPFVLVPLFEPTLDLEVSHGPKITLNLGATLELKTDLLYQGGTTKVNATPTLNPVADISFTKLKVASLKFKGKSLFSLKLFGVAGPYVAPTSYAKVDFAVDKQQGICAEAKKGLEVSLGLKIGPISDKNKLEQPSVSFTIAEMPLFKRCTQPPADAGVQPDSALVTDAGADAPVSCDGATCAPGATRCAGKALQICDTSGCGWAVITTCPCACVSGACTGPLCTAGAKRCLVGTVETCDGCSWKLTESCICGCTGDACTSPCQ